MSSGDAGLRRLRDLLATSSFRQAAAMTVVFVVAISAMILRTHDVIDGILDAHVAELVARDVERQSSAAHFATAAALAEALREMPPMPVRHVAVGDADGRVLYGDPDFERAVSRVCGECGGFRAAADAAEYVGRRVGLADGGHYTVAYDIRPMLAQLRVLPSIADATLICIGVLSLALCIHFSRVNLRRVERISRTLARFAAGDAAARAPSGGHDEFARLGTEINRALDRVNRLAEEVKDSSGRVAHELRTPLTRLQNRLISAADQARGCLRKELLFSIEDIGKVQNLFRAVMRIGEIETGCCAHHFAEIDAAELLGDLADTYLPLAERRACDLEVAVAPGCMLFGDRDLLFQAIANLLDNAFKYAPAGAPIRLVAVAAEGWSEISVIDRGAGIPVAARDLAVQRFRRLDNAANLPGNGLGLPLAAAIAELHRGALVLGDAAPGLVATLRIARDG